MQTLASEGTYWDESEGGNVTVSEFGKYFFRPEGWVFEWRETWG